MSDRDELKEIFDRALAALRSRPELREYTVVMSNATYQKLVRPWLHPDPVAPFLRRRKLV